MMPPKQNPAANMAHRVRENDQAAQQVTPEYTNTDHRAQRPAGNAIPKLSQEARATMQLKPEAQVGGKRDIDAEYEWLMAKARVMSAGQLLFKHIIDEIGINAKHRWCLTDAAQRRTHPSVRSR
jgi:hypothetical protein